MAAPALHRLMSEGAERRGVPCSTVARSTPVPTAKPGDHAGSRFLTPSGLPPGSAQGDQVQDARQPPATRDCCRIYPGREHTAVNRQSYPAGSHPYRLSGHGRRIRSAAPTRPRRTVGAHVRRGALRSLPFHRRHRDGARPRGEAGAVHSGKVVSISPRHRTRRLRIVADERLIRSSRRQLEAIRHRPEDLRDWRALHYPTPIRWPALRADTASSIHA